MSDRDAEMIAAELVSLRKDLLEVSEFVAQLALALGYRGVPPNLEGKRTRRSTARSRS